MFLISQYRLRTLFVFISLMTQFICLELICLSDKGLVNSTHKRDSVLCPKASITVTKTLITNMLIAQYAIYYITRSYVLLYIQTTLFFVSTESEVNLATSVSSFIHNFVVYIIHHLLQFVPWTLLIHRCYQNKTSKLG